MVKNTLVFAGLFSAVLAAGLGVLAATVPIQDSMDHFIADLHRQGFWASWAAVAAAVSAGVQAAAYFLPK